MLGCDVRSFNHEGHLDINVECPEWIVLGVATEDTAHEWQAWLDSNGFELATLTSKKNNRTDSFINVRTRALKLPMT